MSRLVACVLAAVLTAVPAAAQIDPHTALVERAGWDAIAAGRGSAAAQAFREALAADPKNPRLHLGAGMAATLERRDADARDALERALALDPKLTPARVLLGQVLYRLGALSDAIRTYETLIAEAGNGRDARDVQTTLDRWHRELELHDRMQRAIGSHFTVSFEGPAEAELAAQALESLDRAYWRVCVLLSAYPIDPIRVVLYTGEQFRDITRSPSWAAAAYDGTIRVPMRGALDKSGELDRVMAHEFTHALVRTLAARGVPTWLNEGLATALESGDTAWAEKRIQRAGGPAPLRALQSGFGRFTGAEAQLAYATSAVTVRRMLDEAGGVAVANLLRDLGDGIEFNTAFLHRMQRSFADFQSMPF